jgi:2Fe-2S ferredoxin
VGENDREILVYRNNERSYNDRLQLVERISRIYGTITLSLTGSYISLVGINLVIEVHFIDAAGATTLCHGQIGESLMEVGVRNDVPGLLANCRGSCACATCQVYIDKEWLSVTGEPGEDERAMIEYTNNARDSSRLSCQIILSEKMDGLVVHVPEMQT